MKLGQVPNYQNKFDKWDKQVNIAIPIIFQPIKCDGIFILSIRSIQMIPTAISIIV